jgi:hypothetical protein
VTGAPYDDFEVIAKITRGGANLAAATAAFVYSLDGGDTWSPEIAMPTSGVYSPADTDLTLTWTNGAGTAFRVGDKFAFNCTAPGYSTSDLGDAIDVALARPEVYRFIHVIGRASSASGSATMFGTLSTKMDEAETQFRYIFGLMQAADDTDGNLISAFASLVSSRVGVCAGFDELTSQISGRLYKRPLSWSASARLARIPIGEHLGRVASGPIKGITALTRDENATPGLDAARFITARTLVGKVGFYFTRGRLMSATGSDFDQIHKRQVMDVACETVRGAMLEYLNEDLAVDELGLIDEAAARDIETNVGVKLKAAVVQNGQASAASVTVDRASNILSTGIVPVKVRVRPNGKAEDIEVDIGFENPALTAALS